MMLDGLSPDEVTALELATGVPIVCDLDTEGRSKRFSTLIEYFNYELPKLYYDRAE